MQLLNASPLSRQVERPSESFAHLHVWIVPGLHAALGPSGDDEHACTNANSPVQTTQPERFDPVSHLAIMFG